MILLNRFSISLEPKISQNSTIDPIINQFSCTKGVVILPHGIITRSNDLRVENRLRLLEVFRQHGHTINRTKLAEFSGLSQATLTKLCGELSNEGIIECSYSEVVGRGRPLSSYTLSASIAQAVVVSVTIDNITAGLIDYTGRTLRSLDIEADTRVLTHQKLLDEISAAIQQLLTTDETHNLMHIGVSFQGPINSDTGALVWSPILPFENLPVADKLTRIFRVPVSVNNDCTFISRALYHEHADTLGDSFAAVTVTYGVGMGLYLNGRSIRGAESSALELGHVMHERDGALCRCGNRGCIEAYAATYAILRRATCQDQTDTQPAGLVKPDTIKKLVQSARDGDKAAIDAFAAAGSAIGTGVATIFAMFDPIPIALIGYSKDAWDLMSKDFIASVSSASTDKQNHSKLIHFFENSDQLGLKGLAAESVSAMDRGFAKKSTVRCFEQ